MKINIVIPAKGNSTRIKAKNMIKLNGKSLVYLACEKVLKCKNIDNVYLDTDSQEILSDVSELIHKGLKIINRSPLLANNDIGANEMMIYALHSVEECDLLLQTFCTSPLLSSETIDDCIEKFLSNGNEQFDSFFTVVNMQEYLWKDNKPINFCKERLPNSFELEKIQVETHGLYGIRPASLLENKTRVGINPMLIEISKLESFDINDNEDIEILERLYV